MIKPYCLIGLGDIKGIKEDLQFVSETDANFVCGDSLLIATFMSTLRIGEMEEFFKMNERSFIVFEMTPGFFSASIENSKFQDALFGGMIDTNKLFSGEMENNLVKFMDSIKEDLEGVQDIGQEILTPPTIDDLLDKIGKIGLENLTQIEKQYLEDYSNKK